MWKSETVLFPLSTNPHSPTAVGSMQLVQMIAWCSSQKPSSAPFPHRPPNTVVYLHVRSSNVRMKEVSDIEPPDWVYIQTMLAVFKVNLKSVRYPLFN